MLLSCRGVERVGDLREACVSSSACNHLLQDPVATISVQLCDSSPSLSCAMAPPATSAATNKGSSIVLRMSGDHWLYDARKVQRACSCVAISASRRDDNPSCECYPLEDKPSYKFDHTACTLATDMQSNARATTSASSR